MNSADFTLYAIERIGERKWNISVPGYSDSPATFDSAGRILLASYDNEGVNMLAASTAGEPLWLSNLEGYAIRTSPLITSTGLVVYKLTAAIVWH